MDQTQDEFMQMVYALVSKVENLENELKTIKGQMANRRGGRQLRQQNKEDILEKINQPEKLAKEIELIPPFKKWVKESVLPFVKDHLDLVFQNDIIYGIIRLLENSASRQELGKLPIRVFERNGHTHTYFYIFDGVYKNKKDENIEDKNTISWKKVPFSEMETYTWEIYQRFSKDFYNYWCVPNERRIANMDDEYCKLYIDYYKTIMGNVNMSHDKRNYKICSLFYRKLAELE
jgi:hypothetical protein